MKPASRCDPFFQGFQIFFPLRIVYLLWYTFIQIQTPFHEHLSCSRQLTCQQHRAYLHCPKIGFTRQFQLLCKMPCPIRSSCHQRPRVCNEKLFGHVRHRNLAELPLDCLLETARAWHVTKVILHMLRVWNYGTESISTPCRWSPSVWGDMSSCLVLPRSSQTATHSEHPIRQSTTIWLARTKSCISGMGSSPWQLETWPSNEPRSDGRTARE